jgi:hypothetical protein
MAIQYINTGIIANDGTGDDLREAFTKINNNFEEIDLRVIEETLIENTGSLGEGVYAGKSNGIQGFKRLVAGSNITLTATDTNITINSANALDQLIVVTDSGTVTVDRGQTMSIKGGAGINTEQIGQQVILNLDTIGIVSRDSTPVLSANLNAANNNIVAVNVLQANTVQGQGGIPANIEGLIYGFDVREFGPYLTGFDFGSIRNTYNNALEFIIANADLDLGAITPARGDTVDLGLIV